MPTTLLESCPSAGTHHYFCNIQSKLGQQPDGVHSLLTDVHSIYSVILVVCSFWLFKCKILLVAASSETPVCNKSMIMIVLSALN